LESDIIKLKSISGQYENSINQKDKETNEKNTNHEDIIKNKDKVINDFKKEI